MRLFLPTLLATVLLTLPAIASAQVYKWTDANGTTHFSQTPPPKGVKYKSIRTAVEADQPIAGATPKKDTSDDKSKDKATTPREAQLKRMCAQLESNINLLQSKEPVQRLGSDGKPVPMNTQVRAEQLKQQQMRYNAYCK